MVIPLRQSTASQTVLIGPFVDDTDGKTPETALSIAAADIRLSKNGANIAGKNSGGGTHDELGMYAITFDATDSDTVGRLQLIVVKSGALPVKADFQVMTAAAYDAQFGSSATNVIDDAQLTANACNKIADHVRRRTQANVESSSDGDTLSLASEYGAIQQAQSFSPVGSAGSYTGLEVFQTDGETSLGTLDITTAATAKPIRGGAISA
jgi:hypothetical protein